MASKGANRRSEKRNPIGSLVSPRCGGNHVRPRVRFGGGEDIWMKVGSESFIKPPKVVRGASMDRID